ncbi:MAG: phasin family protein [Gammaproteobacteria bacterium]|nr:phasin family protein [Gammaproteobacteria bacterium]
MNKQYFDTMNDAGRQAYDFGRQLADINMRAFDRLTAAQTKAWSEAVEKGFAQARRLAEAKGYKDVVDVQMDMAQDASQSAVAQSRESVEVLTGTRDELVKAYEKGFAQAAGEVKKASPKQAA